MPTVHNETYTVNRHGDELIDTIITVDLEDRAKKTKAAVIKSLSMRYNEIVAESQSIYNERVYMNLPVRKIERVFFRLFAERLNIDSSKLLRRIIRRLMENYPRIVEEAREIVNADSENK